MVVAGFYNSTSLSRLSVLFLRHPEQQYHARDGDQETDAEHARVAEPGGDEAAADAGDDPAQAHQPRADGEVGGLELHFAEAHQVGSQYRRAQAAGELVETVYSGRQCQVA
jgi:hypothetical protein